MATTKVKCPLMASVFLSLCSTLSVCLFSHIHVLSVRYITGASTTVVSTNVAGWEKAFCDQVTGSELFAGVQGCRLLTTDSMETAATVQVGFELEDESPSADVWP